MFFFKKCFWPKIQVSDIATHKDLKVLWEETYIGKNNYIKINKKVKARMFGNMGLEK